MLEGQGLDQHGRPMEWFTTWHRGDQLVFDVDVNDTHESVQPRLRDEPVVPESGQSAAASGDAEDPLARARRWCRRCPPNWNACERPAEEIPGASRAKSWIIHPARRGVAMSGPPPVAPCPRLENLPMMRRSAAMSALCLLVLSSSRWPARRPPSCPVFRERQGHDQRPDPIAFVREMALTLDYMKTRLTFNSNKTSGHVVENFPVGVFTLVIPSEPVALTLYALPASITVKMQPNGDMAGKFQAKLLGRASARAESDLPLKANMSCDYRYSL